MQRRKELLLQSNKNYTEKKKGKREGIVR
jgi:hypothetical protein